MAAAQRGQNKSGRLADMAPKDEITVPAREQIKLEDGKQKVHVSLYLKGQDVPLWERPGKEAFAKHHKKLHATDAEFKELFEKY